MTFNAYACACGDTLTLVPGQVLGCCRNKGIVGPSDEELADFLEARLEDYPDAAPLMREFIDRVRSHRE